MRSLCAFTFAVVALIVPAVAQPLYRPVNDQLLIDLNGLQIVANGNLSVVPADLQICSNLNPNSSCNAPFEVSFQSTISAALEVRSEVSGSFTKEWPLDLIVLPAFNVPNYTVTPYIYLTVGVTGSMDANMVVSVVEQWGIGSTLSIGGSGLISATANPPSKAFQIGKPIVTQGSNATLEVFIKAYLYFDVWTAQGTPLGGPLLSILPSATLTVQPANNPWWTATSRMKVDSEWLYFGASTQQMNVFDQTFPIGDAGGPLGNLSTLAESRWARTYGLPGVNMTGNAIDLDANGNLLLAGKHGGHQTVLQIAGDGSVNHESRVDFQAGTESRPTDIQATSDGGYIVAGNRIASGAGGYLAKYDANHAEEWVHRYDTALTHLEEVVEVSGGGFVAAGSINGHPWLFKVDAQGNHVWGHEFQSAVAGGGDLRALRELADGRIAAAGQQAFTDAPGNILAATINHQNAFVMVVDAAGSLQWAKVIGNTALSRATSLCEAANGDLIVGGFAGAETQHAFACRLDGAGALVWSKTYAGENTTTGAMAGNTPWDVLTDIERTEGGFIVTGQAGLGSDINGWLFKMDDAGRVIWFKSFRGPSYEYLNDLEVLPDGNIAVIGTTRDFTVGTADVRDEVFVIRTSVEGMLHFVPDMNGMQIVDVHNDDIATSATDTHALFDVPGVLQPIAPTPTTPALPTSDPNVIVTLRSI